jgi:peptidoglycan hydrolase-like protein with peptidoglycan-binding domain
LLSNEFQNEKENIMAHPTLQLGSKGDEVRLCQSILVKCGAPGYDYKEVDGDFGPITEKAVKWFQQQKGLKVDGIVGPKTWAELDKVAAEKQELSEDLTVKEIVKKLQTGLKASLYPDTDPGAIDGKFGPKTKKAVQAYQKAIKVDKDGIVGQITWHVISDKNKALIEWAGIGFKPC